MSGVEARLARLHRLYPRLIDLSLARLERLLADLGHPERQLPPVIHVAGTNGKGSVCAFIRAMAEGAGLRVHVYSSPHLVRFNERIRLAGRLIEDAMLDAVFDAVEQANGDAPITVFEMITAASLVAMAQVPADLAVIEVGLGGRLDATNVIPAPRVAAITSISMDHQDYLGDRLAGIAAEKAGIIKTGCVAVMGAQGDEVAGVIAGRAAECGVSLLARGVDWDVRRVGAGFQFSAGAFGLDLPMPGLAGAHQLDNAGIAIAALRASGLAMDAAAGMRAVEWPGRMQRLGGVYRAMLGEGSQLWLDGAHNPGGAEALAAVLREWGGETHLIVGMKQSKDCAEFLRIVMPYAASVQAVAEPGQHLALPVEEIIAASGGVAVAGPTVAAALARLAADGARKRVVICGSLYLAGVILAA
ncbi:MAG TPA: folylpolyglutamate synthase/dihydrofolate synthase family protein [Acidiphilium sp.]|nr:MAG: bifunctional folylpolyglutamate synthase/dihydrofolate synthase [Acidiphilium sp. 21-60-14]OYV89388.1 MAG: bifunctional folylpolyglutamate synthase/dihydrofolate synthase [Acidiphilium sp. 37-60-79]OZB41092.1 MAG: bifunctional folylpolyglutamate synthase/dihydrofolate synthase [Acidiphilium sp. 34-60-192]HQT89354.1 folylpolyglutamate synthase/dihydrofolate synthase family protein [Acidiphilium sp.]HQU25211.1 folylpolyglutamate synthase/dihydrofolate synthase family protein [Acidiphilium